MDFDPKIRFRPWQTALLGVLLATGLVFVFAPEVSLLGTSAEPQAGPPTPTTVVPARRWPRPVPSAQQIVPGQAPITRAPGLPTTGGPTYGPPLVQGAPGPAGLQPRSATTCVPQSSDVNLTALSFNIHSALGRGDRLGLSADRDTRSGRGTPTSSLLQEVDRGRRQPAATDQPGYLAEQLGMEVAFGSQRDLRAGPSTASRPCRSTRSSSQSNTHLPERPEPPRGPAARRPEHADQGRATPLISVYNTHLQHMSLRRLRHPPDAARSRASCATDPLPKILGGDLNSGPRIRRARRRRAPSLQDAVGLPRARASGPATPPRPRNPRGTDRLPAVLRPAGAPVAPRCSSPQVSDHRAVRSTFSCSASGSNQSACPSSTNPWRSPSGRLRSHGSRRGTHPRGPCGVTN